MNCFELKKRAPLKGVITGVAVNVKVDQLKGRFPVFVMLFIWRRRQGGVSGETEVIVYSFEFGY